MLNTLAAFAVAASLGIGMIFGSLIALCAFERLMLGRPARIAVEVRPSASPKDPVPRAALPVRQVVPVQAQGTLKSAKSNPGETTQVTSDSTVAEATARCQVPAGTRT